MKKYVPSVRDIPGVKRAPVLAESNLSGEWVPPRVVYLASDVDEHMAAVGESTQGLLNRIAELEHQLDIRKAAIDAQHKLLGRVRELEKALRKHGGHLEMCAQLGTDGAAECDCGFAALVATS